MLNKVEDAVFVELNQRLVGYWNMMGAAGAPQLLIEQPNYSVIVRYNVVNVFE